MHEVLGPASDKEKLDLVIRKFGYSGIEKSLSDNEKLCYCAMGAANIYNDCHKLTSGAPSMLHSLIREIPEFFSQFIVDDGAEQQMEKGEE